jgi:integrase
MSKVSKQANRLTAKRIERLTERGRYHDGHGLVLQVTRRGSRSWLLRYERDGRERWLGLGPLHVVSLKLAREKANAARLKILNGIDPVDEKREKRNQKRIEEATAVSFKQAAERYLAAHEASWRNDAHRKQWHATLTTYAFPVIGALPVASITTDLVLKVLEPIWAAKTVTAGRLRGRIERILDWAKARNLRSGENPAAWRGHLDHLLAKSAPKQHLPALPFDEVPAFMSELRQRESVAARALEIVVLTATRVGEALDATWSEFDLPNKIWTIPAEHMKAGKEDRIPLTDRVIDILESLPHEEGNACVFLSAREGSRLTSSALLKLTRTMRPGITVHGFRSAFRDWAAERTNFPREIAEAALAHAVGDATERAYRRGDALEKRRKLMVAWADYCAELPRTGEIISFPHG